MTPDEYRASLGYPVQDVQENVCSSDGCFVPDYSDLVFLGSVGETRAERMPCLASRVTCLVIHLAERMSIIRIKKR